MLKAKLSSKFYIISCFLLAAVIIGWYGIYFMNANEILMDGGTPMAADTKTILTIMMSLVVLSWSMSLVTMIRQMILGSAFIMDENGIHNTATAIIVLAFIFIIPVKRIPYNAIEQVSVENGIFTIRIDKSKVQATPFLKPFVRKEYHFFSGFTKEETETIKNTLSNFIKL